MNNIGLIGYGNAQWIAGVHYQQGLLYGNSLLPPDQQAAFHLLLRREQHDPDHYQTMQPYLQSLYALDYFPSLRPEWSNRLRYVLRKALRERKLAFPTNEFPRLLRALRIDAIFPANDLIAPRRSVRQVSWITDFQHVHLPEFFPAKEIAFRNQVFERLMRLSDTVIVSNQFSYTDAVRLYPAYAHKVALLPFTMYLDQHWSEPDVAAYRQQYGLPDKYLLFPSQFWKHKNHALLFEAIRLLRQRGVDDMVLVCTGSPHDYRAPAYFQQLQQFITNHRLDTAIRILGLLPRHDQVQLMRGAAAVVQPSLFEGWSALLEDCRSLGKRVFASDIPMHHEQLTPQTTLFDPRSAHALAECLETHWPSLTPGPDPLLEATADHTYQQRIGQFAQRFITICQSVTQRPLCNT